ncbi:MAG TPA: serine hydrolase domain-containing protein [Chitinophagaceae bacterium]|nr:serine hydrolase domain-containing protein [Chitinophagaceae bacterium]
MSVKHMIICLKCSLLALFLLFFQVSRAQTYDWGALDAALEANKKLLGENVVVMIWKKDDTLVYKKENKFFNSKAQAPVASASKWLTAALVMQFVDEGLLSLDDKVVQWVPEFEKYFKNYITIRHCLSHMTGIEDDNRVLKNLVQRKKFMSLEEEVNSFAGKKIRSNAGVDFWYGHIGLNIAARVVEAAGKKRFEVLMKQKLLNPLEMRRTNFTSLDGSPVNPSGGASSTADDYMKFLVMLLNKGKYKDKQILSEAAVEQMMQLKTSPELIRYAPAAAKGLNYALGSWAIEEKDGRATALASPGLFGTWPMVDFCRGYAYLVFVKDFLNEEKAELHKQLKAIVDEQISGNCN